MTPLSDRVAALSVENMQLREALGAHIQADAYRDSFPDDEEDARYLRKQEAFWRLAARSWIDERLSGECAQVAKERYVQSPEFQAKMAATLAPIMLIGV